MYIPAHFQEERVETLRELVEAYPFATLVSPGSEGLIASHLPILWDPEPAPLGTLRGHLARANPHGRGAPSVAEQDALAIFLGPAGYVSPSWLPSKREHGKVVPTWNYVAVHVYGPLSIVDDAEWLRDLVTRLTVRHERFSSAPWEVEDAPAPFIDAMLRAIVGVEIPVRRAEGKWKLSQNRPDADRAGTIAGLEARGDAPSRALADAMRARDASK